MRADTSVGSLIGPLRWSLGTRRRTKRRGRWSPDLEPNGTLSTGDAEQVPDTVDATTGHELT